MTRMMVKRMMMLRRLIMITKTMIMMMKNRPFKTWSATNWGSRISMILL